MASVLHLAQLHSTHLFPDTEPPSLSLDLSLGGLFSKQNGDFHISVENLKASHNLKSSVKNSKAHPTPPLGINDYNTGLDPSHVDLASLPNAYHEPAELLRTRSSLAQRRHEARKRRKSIIEGKLHKRAKGDSQYREELTASNAQYLETLMTPGCHDGGSIRDANKVSREEFVSKEDVLGSAYSESISSWAVESKDVSISHMCSMPGALVDYMNVLGSQNDVRFGVPSLSYADGRCGTTMVGDVSYVCESSNSLQDTMVSELMYKQDVSSDGKQGLNGDVTFVHPSVQSCASPGRSILTSCAPYAGGQKQPFAKSATRTCGGNAHLAEVTVPTHRSSNELLSWHAGEMHNSAQISMGSGDNSECIDRSCNSSSSEIENANDSSDHELRKHESMQANISRCKEEAVHIEQAQPSVRMPAGVSTAYPHSFPVMPIPFPYGVPLPWGYSLPWFSPGSIQNAFGVPIAAPPSSKEAKEASFFPRGGFPAPYNFSVPGSNITTPWIPFVPSSGLGTSTSSESSIPTLHPCQKSENISESVQDAQPRNDSASGFDTRTASVEEQEGNNCVLRQAEHAVLNEPMKEMEGRDCLVAADGKLSAPMQIDKLPAKQDSASALSSRPCIEENCPAGGMQRSTPLAKKSASKKKKVRFNSLDGAAARSTLRGGNEACQSVDGKADSISSSQQYVGAFSSSTQSEVEPPNSEHSKYCEVDPTRCADARQNSNCIEDCMSSDKNLKVGDADDVMHANGVSGDGELDEEAVVVDGSATLRPCKSDTKDKTGSQSIASLPRVITRGSGPHAKTIHGVMYITKEKQARLICICHGKHMSPLEFVRHSGSTDISNPERSIVLEPFTYVEQEASVPA